MAGTATTSFAALAVADDHRAVVGGTSHYGLLHGDSAHTAGLLEAPKQQQQQQQQQRRRRWRGGWGWTSIREPHVLLRVVFLALLAVIAALAVAAMIVITRGLAQSYNDTRSVYVGGVALYLTETGYADMATMQGSPTSTAAQVAAAAADLYRMRAALTTGVDLYLHGNVSASPPYYPTTNPKIAALVAALVAPANTTVAAIDVIQHEVLVNNATANATLVAAAMQTILASETTLLGLQAGILVAISVQALANVEAVQTAQYIFMGVILGVLVLIALAVYVPVERRIKHMTRALEAKNADLLRATNELTLLLQLSPHGIFRADPAGHLTYANERWHDLTGLDAPDRDAWLGTVVHPDDRAAVRAAWALVLRDAATAAASQIMALEFRLVRPAHDDAAADRPGSSGRVSSGTATTAEGARWVLLQCRVDLAEGVDGRTAIRSVMGSLADVTDRKRLEQEKLDLLAHAAAAAEAHQREQEEFVDTICHGIRNPLNGILNNVDLLRESLQRALYPLPPPAVDDSDAAVVSPPPPPDSAHAESTPALLLLSSSSITDGASSASGWPFANTAELMEAVDAIETCANYQRVIADDVLSLSRLQAVGAVLHPADFRLGDLVRTVLVMFMAEARADDIELVADVSSSTAGMVVCHDRERLAQILANLLANAIKFTRSALPGRRRVTLRAAVDAAAQPRPQLTLAVRDTGPGIALADQPLLFRRFRQVGDVASGTTRAYHAGGSGLGLSICKVLVDIMGGTISVHSTPGDGAEFAVTVPCALGGSVASPPLASPRSPALPLPAHDPIPSPRAAPLVSSSGGGGGSSGTVRVLVAEDNTINQAVLRRQLRMASKPGGLSFEVAIANNGQEAVDLLQRGDAAFDVVLMDVDMPVLDGIAATRTLRGCGVHVPIVGLSGNARQEHVHAALAAGMQAYLIKPYTRKDLVAAVVRVVHAS